LIPFGTCMKPHTHDRWLLVSAWNHGTNWNLDSNATD
jgi:hypothetical protein